MNTNINRVGGLMLPSKRPLYMGNILNVAPKIGNINLPTMIKISKSRVHYRIFSIVIVIIFSKNRYNDFRKLTLSCRCACRCGGSSTCCTSCGGGEFSDACIRSASITLIKHI